MQLTKEQIHLIDKYLIRIGLNYWDLRLELIDHIASHLEGKNIDFDMDYLRNNFPYYKINKIVSLKKRYLNTKYKKLAWKEFKHFFYNPFYFTVSVCFVLFQNWIYINYGFKNLYIFDIILLMFPTLLLIYNALRNWYKGNRSYNLVYIFNLTIGMISLLNIAVFMHKSAFLKKISIFLFIASVILLLIKMIIGLKLYKKVYRNYIKIYSEYKSLCY